MSRLSRCDVCGKTAESVAENFATLEIAKFLESRYNKINVDICPECDGEIRMFMKGLAERSSD